MKAKESEKVSVVRFGIVTSGRRLTKKDVSRVADVFENLRVFGNS
ncbi:hypothetical protein [Thermotoga sp.]|nr:hypothetical protein [Thermotoga sp.]